jgi:hypothetical protein
MHATDTETNVAIFEAFWMLCTVVGAFSLVSPQTI